MKKRKLVPLERQREDAELMRWLYSKGVRAWELAEMRVGAVDEFEKKIKVHPEIRWQLLTKDGEVIEGKGRTPEKISFAGTKFEERLKHGAIYSGFLFTKTFPLKRCDPCCGYSEEEIEKIVAEIDKIVLTKPLTFDRIRVTKANIKSQEQESGTKNKRHIRMPTV